MFPFDHCVSPGTLLMNVCNVFLKKMVRTIANPARRAFKYWLDDAFMQVGRVFHL